MLCYSTLVNLYHSFPRGPRKDDSTYGLAVLESILDIGLLITPEEAKAPRCAQMSKKLFLQRRLCFTALNRKELPRHADTFGPFSFEFDPADLRDFGVLPAFYLSMGLPSGKLLHQAGGYVLRSIVAIKDMIKTMLDRRDGGTRAEKKLIYSIFSGRLQNKKEFELRHLFWALDAVLNLYYPTEDLERNSILGYYEQREWRITPNFSKNRKWHYPKVEREARENLLKLNPRFFKKALKTSKGRRIDYCYSFPTIGKRRLLDRTSCLFVPKEAVAQAKQLVKKHGYSFPVRMLPPTKRSRK